MKYLVQNSLVQSIEIDNNLERIKFFYSFEDYQKSHKKIISALEPSMTSIGNNCYSGTCFEICYMDDLSLMSQINKAHIEQQLGIGDKKHTIEYILENANKAGLISEEFYQTIQQEISKRIDELREENRQQQEQFKKLSKQLVENSHGFTPSVFKEIKNYKDIEEFKGKVIAFEAVNYKYQGASYDSMSTRFRLFAFYGYISDEAFDVHAGEEGYSIKVFKKKGDRQQELYLTDSQLTSYWVNLKMRLPTNEELKYLKLACCLREGVFEYCTRRSSIEIFNKIESINDKVSDKQEELTEIRDLEKLLEPSSKLLNLKELKDMNVNNKEVKVSKNSRENIANAMRRKL